jgi:hypothetical protein
MKNARKVASPAAWPVLLCLLTLNGCITWATVQDIEFATTNRLRADIAWLDCYSFGERRELGCHYRAGFKRGFTATAVGRDCKLPPVAPPRYWSTWYQSPEGRADVQEWFRGYQAGINTSQRSQLPAYSDVPLGPCTETLNVPGPNAGCYATDVCNTRTLLPGQSVLGTPQSYGYSSAEYDSPYMASPVASPIQSLPEMSIEQNVPHAIEDIQPQLEVAPQVAVPEAIQ